MIFIKIITALLIFINAAIVEVTATDLALERKLARSCKKSQDCRRPKPCVGRNCPPRKICVDGTCQKKSNFDKCGPNYCNTKKNEFCCNASCGICVPDGGQCIDIACTACKKDSDCPTINCITTPCPQYKCKKNICELQEIEEVPCGKNVCTGGDVCCNPNCGICTPPGGAPDDCSELMCVDNDVPCGGNTCFRGETCCNESCGICALPGEDCIKKICLD